MRYQTWDFNSAEAQAWGERGVAVFRPHGVVCEATAPQLLDSAQDMMRDWQIGGLLADYTHSRLAVSARGLLDHAVHTVGRGGSLAAPTALLVPAQDAAFWRLYAGLMARQGIVRGVFVALAPAMDWVRCQAALHAAERGLQCPMSLPMSAPKSRICTISE